MKRTRNVTATLIGVGVLTMLCAAVVAAPRPEVVETFPEPVTSGIDPVRYHEDQRLLHEWLASEMPPGTLEQSLRITVSSDEMRNLDRVDAEDPGKTVVGLTKGLAHVVDLTRINRRAMSRPGLRVSGGAIRSTDDGGFVWATTVKSEGANALRVRFAGLHLPTTADLFVYSPDGMAFGPYRDETGDLWSNTVFGSTAIVQLHHYGAPDAIDLARMSFVIEEVGHIGPKFLPAALAPQPGAPGTAAATGQVSSTTDLLSTQTEADPSTAAFCGFNASCVENAQCGGGPSWGAKSDAENATGLMLWVAGAFINTCSGALIADTDGSTQTPYFLTANHCVSKQKDAKNLETYFRFQVNCGGSCPAEWSGGGIQRNGADLRKTGNTGDYTLLELRQSPPSGSVFMGWTTANVANADGTQLYRIHHPSTAPQSYSAHTVDTSAGQCQGVPRGSWIYSRDTHGATEGGSSGSVVYNGAGQVVGQLTGACGTNTGNTCDNVNNATVDGAFAGYFSGIAEFLDPSPCSPSPEVCDDGADNDCDGATDCNDSDCTGDPACDGGGSCANPGGAPPGSGCSSNSECCSDKCKGPPSNKTCR